MTYTFDEKDIGLLQIANTDAGYTTANGTALAIPTPPAVLGSVVRAFDPTSTAKASSSCSWALPARLSVLW